MTIAPRLEWYLDTHGVEYEIVAHARTTARPAPFRLLEGSLHGRFSHPI